MSQKIQSLISFLLLSLITCQGYAFTNSLYISEEQLQQRVEKAFPVQIGNEELGARFFSPRVVLSKTQNRIEIHTRLLLQAGKKNKQELGLGISGTPYYVAEKTEFRLRQLRVEDIDTSSLSLEESLQTQVLVNLALTELMADIPIYTLDDNNLREKIAKRRLKSAQVVDGELELTFSLD